jgi:hypothetical protein
MHEQQKRAIEVTRDPQTLEGDNLDVWREQVDRARQASQHSYDGGFRDALALYYRDMAKAYEKGTQRG